MNLFSIVFCCLNFTNPAELEIRLAPDEVVYLNENNRRIGIYDAMLHNIGIVNHANETVVLQRLEIVGLSKGAELFTHVLPLDQYQRRWASLKSYFDRPGVQQSQDSIFMFSKWLKEGIHLSPTASLEPNSAILVERHLLAFSHNLVPELLSIRAYGFLQSGHSVEARAALKLVQYQSKNSYILPLKGRWYINASSAVRSHHRARPAHEFAIDFLKIGQDGKSHRGSGTRHDHYFAFGEPVYAIGDGRVVRAKDGVPETELPKAGESRRDFGTRVLDAMWEKDPSGGIAEGNLVILEHAGGEYSVYVHLQHGSIRVNAGDKVKQGQIIGKVGLSGDGFQPHLHFQVNGGPDPQYSRALPVYFTNVRPVAFASTADMGKTRMFMAGEFVETFE